MKEFLPLVLIFAFAAVIIFVAYDMRRESAKVHSVPPRMASTVTLVDIDDANSVTVSEWVDAKTNRRYLIVRNGWRGGISIIPAGTGDQ